MYFVAKFKRRDGMLLQESRKFSFYNVSDRTTITLASIDMQPLDPIQRVKWLADDKLWSKHHQDALKKGVMGTFVPLNEHLGKLPKKRRKSEISDIDSDEFEDNDSDGSSCIPRLVSNIGCVGITLSKPFKRYRILI